MPLGSWFRPPQRLTTLFLAVTLVPSVLVVALGWLLFRQDGAGESQRLRDRRGEAADLVVAELSRSLSETEQALHDSSALHALATADGAVAVMFSTTTADVHPKGRLAYLPVASPGREAGATTFAAGEHLEYRQHDSAKAANWFQQRARSTEPGIRGGALIGLARNLKKMGDVDRALAVYDEAASLTDASVAGVPVSLLARSARCGLLVSSGRSVEGRSEAAALLVDLQRGAWPITRAVYEANVADAHACIGAPIEHVTPALPEALAAAAAGLWERWQNRRLADGAASVRELQLVGDIPLVVVRRQVGDRVIALIAGPRYVENEWLARAKPALALQNLSVALRVPSRPSADPEEIRRASGETGLPWTIAVTGEGAQREQARLARRRAMWLAGLGALSLTLLAGATVTARAVTRELAAARLQSDFVAAVSHEFRTPLTTLRQLTEALTDDRLPSESRRHVYYEALARQTDRLRRLVESLLDFGRLEAGSAPYRQEPLDAMRFVRGVTAEFAAESAARGMEVDLQTSGSDAVVFADHDALANALWNLLDNAVKYSPDCRTIAVVVERASNGVAIRVRDRGFGIPHDEQRQIFEKFVRGARAKSDGIKGTGIGLSIVQHVVAAHGGHVQVQSEPGAGTTFTIWLPMAPAAREEQNSVSWQESS